MCGQSVEIEEMPSYESVKSSVRLLLTSASNGLTLDQLNADYQHYHQLTSIPYAAFGYSTLVIVTSLLVFFIVDPFRLGEFPSRHAGCRSSSPSFRSTDRFWNENDHSQTNSNGLVSGTITES